MTRPPLTTVKQLVVGQLATNCYLFIDLATSAAIIIDPGDDSEYIMENVERLKAKPQLLVATHGHFDHLLGARALQAAYNLPFRLSAADLFLVDQMEQSAKYYLRLRSVDPPPQVTGTLKDYDKLKIGRQFLTVIETPGHTPGSLSLYCPSAQVVFVGDTLFAGGGHGRTDFSYSNSQRLANSIKKLLRLRPETVVYSGHGEATSIGELQKFDSV